MTAGIVAQDVVVLKVPGQAQYVGVVRLAVAGLANQLDFPFDEAEDLKLAVTEVCSTVLRSARFKIDLHVDFRFTTEELSIQIAGVVEEPRQPSTDPDGIDADLDVGMSLVEALMDTIETTTDEETGAVSVKMSRQLPTKEESEA